MSGDAAAIVATNAFGMGIDKADVRTVCHALGARLARGLLPGGGPRRPRRPAGPLPAVRRAARQGPARVLHPARRSVPSVTAIERVGERLRWRARRTRRSGAYDAVGRMRRRRWPGLASRARGRRRDGGRRPRRSSATWPAPACWRRRRRRPIARSGTIAGGWDRRAAALCLASAREAERVRWAQYRAVWELRRGPRVPARRRCWRTSATAPPERRACDVL